MTIASHLVDSAVSSGSHDSQAFLWGIDYCFHLPDGERLPQCYWYENGVVKYLWEHAMTDHESIECWLWEE